MVSFVEGSPTVAGAARPQRAKCLLTRFREYDHIFGPAKFVTELKRCSTYPTIEGEALSSGRQFRLAGAREKESD
jgi:hypothetical protein